jgi:hypothetical protein
MLLSMIARKRAGCSRPSGQKNLAPAVAALAALVFGQAVLPSMAETMPVVRRDFRGVWAVDGSGCRVPNEHMLIYERRVATFPHRGSLEPGRRCRILSVAGAWPEWALRLSCVHTDPAYQLPAPFEVRQTLRMSAASDDMVVETSPVLGQPARIEDAFHCRRVRDPEPMLRCLSRETGRTVPCEP